MQKMGVKRHLEGERYAELSFKQPKQLDTSNELTLLTRDIPSNGHILGVEYPGKDEGNVGKFHPGGARAPFKCFVDCASLVNKELDENTPLSSITSSGSEEDAGNKETSHSFHFPGYINFSIPWPSIEKFEDPYIIFMNSSPRKQVPVGPDHQTEIPMWNPSDLVRDLSLSDNFVKNVGEQRFLGMCIIPKPRCGEGSSFHGEKVGDGRKDCNCLDIGSIRCVQQHVKEAREKLKEKIGDETFRELGFHDMGEEVARFWTAEEEDIFHDVMFSYPASHGQDFWKHLSSAFPTRTMKELVSYYFNVFMLRKRAAQNRSSSWAADSDGDDAPWVQDRDNDNGDMNPTNDNFYIIGGQYEGSGESSGDEHTVSGYGFSSRSSSVDEDSDEDGEIAAAAAHEQDYSDSGTA